MGFSYRRILLLFIICSFIPLTFSKTIKVGIYLKKKKVFVSSNSRILIYRSKRKIGKIPANTRVFFWIKGVRKKKNTSEKGWYVQAGAFKKMISVRKCTEKLSKITDFKPVIEKSSRGFYLVRFGPFESLSEAGALKDSLKMSGFPDVFIVASKGRYRNSVYLIDSEYNKRFISHYSFVLKSKSFIKVNGVRYRGEIEIKPMNGKINVINIVDIEDYLKGVVPAEMSPKLYPSIEALKAQAVAARTYVYYNLGQFKQMGFDICATQSCQVYKGVDVERDLSSEAVDDTIGEIITYKGKPINAMFTAYCGGHTEDFEKIFGGRPVPYLRGVKCEGEGDFPHKTISSKITLESTSTPYISRPYLAIAVLYSKGLIALNELDGLNEYWGKGFAQAFLDRVLKYLGIEVKNIPLKSSKLSEIGEYLSMQIFDTESIKPLFESNLIVQDLPEINAKKIDVISIGYALLKGFEKIDYYNLDFMIVDKDFLYGLESPEFLLVNQGKTELSLPVATIRVGDRIRVITGEDNLPVAVVMITPESQEGINDSFLSGYFWYKFLTINELNERAAKFGFKKPVEEIKVLEKTDTGRVIKIRVLSGKYSRVYSGIKVRWFFGVKENKFELYKRYSENGKLKGVYIVGNAWGHGVGMCQIGAFGLALKGWDYKSILKHYYTGVKVEVVE